MEKPEFSMEDVVTLVNSCEGEFIIHVEFGKGEFHGDKEETVQT